MLNQISSLEAEASARTPNQQKISSHLWYAAKMNAGQAVAGGVPTLSVGVAQSFNGYVVVDIRADVTDTLLDQITGLGGQIGSSFPKYHSIRATLPLSKLETIAGLAGIKFIKPAVYPTIQGNDPAVTRRAGVMRMLAQYFRPLGASHKGSSIQTQLPGLYNALKNSSVKVGFTPGTGSVDSEGDTTHRAITARSTFHVDGTGIKIGVMSDSDDSLESSQASGDLGTVTVLSGQSGRPGSGEGTAMMEIVHDIAPGAAIEFASSGGSEAQMATNIEGLAAAGCNIIVDDIAFSDESPFQDGIVAQAVQTVTAQGVLYFSSADNFGNFTDNTSSCWQGDYVASPGTISGTGGGTVAQLATVNGSPLEVDQIGDNGGGGQNPILFWNDPLGHSSNDYNLFILDSTASNILGASTDVQNGTQDPVEFISGVPDGDLAVIVLHSGVARYLHMDLASQNGVFKNAWSTGRTRGHATVNSVGAYGVAATPASAAFGTGQPSGPFPNPFSGTNVTETFSSDGPSHQFYKTDGTAITTDLTHTGGLFIQKPDITAADGVTTSLTATVTGGESFAPFFGTSAAAPHAAALTGLLLSYAPGLTQAQVRSLLTSTSIDIMTTGADRDAGFGIIDAVALLTAAPAPAVPTITSFTPTSGPVGTSVTITGTNLTGATAVTFHGTAATTFTVVSATKITATVPTGATTGTIAVTTPNGTATSSASFTVTAAAPTITSFTPTTGPVGTSVTITGTNFTGATAVKFHGTAATFTVASATSITTTVPTGATTGQITVTTPGGIATSAASFTVTTVAGAPTVTSFSPTSGTVGTSVTIVGTNFTGATAVKFNGTAATTFTVVTAAKITATVPAGATTGAIAVTTSAGTGTSSTNFTVTVAAPTITSFTPTSGPPGTSVTITGTGFTGATAVKFHGTVATTFTVVSATSITATVPATATTGQISVTTPAGTATSAASFTITVAAPTITTFQPASGPVGTSVIIAGTNFTGATAVAFNGKAATAFTVNSAQFITATVPAGSTTGKITVKTPGGTATSTANYTVTASAPTVTSFTPASGPVGTKITVTGTNLTGATAVKVNGFACTSVTVLSATSVTAIVPTGATTGNVSVTTPGGLGYSPTAFVVTLPVPTVTTFAPTTGFAGKVITVKGTNFTGATSVTFNGVASTSITAITATSLNATVPTGATTGKIAVTTPGGTGTSASSFAVTAAPPTIVTFQPQSGPVGTKVIIAGTNFTGATSVKFNGKASALITVNSDQLITAPVPAGATTGFVTVTTPGGTVTSTIKFTVTP